MIRLPKTVKKCVGCATKPKTNSPPVKTSMDPFNRPLRGTRKTLADIAEEIEMEKLWEEYKKNRLAWQQSFKPPVKPPTKLVDMIKAMEIHYAKRAAEAAEGAKGGAKRRTRRPKRA